MVRQTSRGVRTLYSSASVQKACNFVDRDRITPKGGPLQLASDNEQCHSRARRTRNVSVRPTDELRHPARLIPGLRLFHSPPNWQESRIRRLLGAPEQPTLPVGGRGLLPWLGVCR